MFLNKFVCVVWIILDYWQSLLHYFENFNRFYIVFYYVSIIFIVSKINEILLNSRKENIKIKFNISTINKLNIIYNNRFIWIEL